MADRERRTAPRLEKHYRVEFREFKFPLNRQPAIKVESLDISEGGLQISTPQRLNVGDKLQVKVFIASFNKYHPGFMKVFESDANQFFQAIGEVAWVEEKIPLTSYTMGVRFVDIDHDDWQALSRLISKYIEA
jgi:c-di-GMP-binding flagellar brake protein YcgR